MAFDSTPSDLPTPDDPLAGPRAERRLAHRRSVVLALVLGLLVVSGLVVTGVADAAEHEIAHAFPDLMLGGCGGG